MALDLTGYNLTFSDEFTGDYLNTSIWQTKYRWGGNDARTLTGNNEKQYYADRSTAIIQKYPELDPFKVTADQIQPEDGILTITAQKSPDSTLTQNLPYVSGLITTDGTFSQTYGYFEISAQVPAGQGLWPAFWLLPTSGTWPPEIDILEFLGHDTNTYYAGAHWTGSDGSHKSNTMAVDTTLNLTGDFHEYGLMWTADTLTFYFNREQVATMATPAGMDQPMYLLANLAVGGNWPGDPDPTKIPAEYKIDYIKVWSGPAPAGKTLVGSAANETLTGYAGNDTISGLAGNDSLDGGAGDDQISGGDGNDQLFGRGGKDTLAGGAGKDVLTGGADADVFVFRLVSESSNGSRDTVADMVSGTDFIDLRGIDANIRVADDQAFAFIGGSTFSGQAGQLRFSAGVLSGDVNGDRSADFVVSLTGVTSLKAADFYL